MIIEVIGKVASLFKKSAPAASADDAPVADELYNDLDEAKTINTGTPDTKDSDYMPLVLGGAALATILLLRN